MLERLHESKEPLSLTVDGEERAVLMSPTAFTETWHLAEDEKFYEAAGGVSVVGIRRGARLPRAGEP